MGQLKSPPPCVPFVAAFSTREGILEEIWARLQQAWGPIADLSPPFDFVESEYYHASMGVGLKKQLALFRDFCDPADLADRKHFCNAIEASYAKRDSQQHPDHPHAIDPPERPVNIDPGYVSMTKLVLASTKNREHRIYLLDGIYAEVTLAFRDQQWQPMPWTYADYCREDFRAFLLAARGRFVSSLRRPTEQQHRSSERNRRVADPQISDASEGHA